MNVRTLCLAILNFGDMTGYDIRKLSNEGKFSHFVDASYGSIYPALARLESDGLVTSMEVPQPGKPARKVYSITDAGRDEFVQTLKIPPHPDSFKSEFLLIAVCAPMMPVDDVRRAIDLRKTQLQAELDVIVAAKCEGDQPSMCWAARYGEACVGTSLQFLLENRQELEDMAIQDQAFAEAAE